ncbi:ras guanine nucleotide exchange factor domain-containing protein [Xylariales sp. PMI_506]|nr:ras guanine nucleotide exchange factor domain-containing protein [Xylariales sp. PMI_506]
MWNDGTRNSNVTWNESHSAANEARPWFLQDDLEFEIRWDLKASQPTIKGGTLRALVEQLTRNGHDRWIPDFEPTFLLTYRLFTTAYELFDAIRARFDLEAPEGLSPAELEQWLEERQKPTRSRILDFLMQWLGVFWMEEMGDNPQELLGFIQKFASENSYLDDIWCQRLNLIIEDRLSDKAIQIRRPPSSNPEGSPNPILPSPKAFSKLQFLDISAIEMARQLTLIEFNLFDSITPRECLDYMRQSSSNGSTGSSTPQIQCLIEHSNSISNWITALILTPTDTKKRVGIIQHFTAVAEECRNLNNFATLTSIMAGFAARPIARLKKTWELVSARYMSKINNMRQLMSPTRGFADYRTALSEASRPCIPFVGIYVTDLRFIESGISSYLPRSDMINFKKSTKTAEVIRNIQHYQEVPYTLRRVKEIQQFILGNLETSQDLAVQLKRSETLEPNRRKEDERITRYA